MPASATTVCTSILCDRPASALVAWRTNPEGLPFCEQCARKLAEHGDTVLPLPPPPDLPLAS